MAQQTATEWLENELADKLKLIVLNNDYRMMEKLFEQAKEMEKEQIMNAWRNGDNDSMYDLKELDKQAEQYYNETYNK